MDIDFPSSILLLLLLLPLFIFLGLPTLFKAIQLPSKPDSNPNPNPLPGPTKLPLIGNLHQLLLSLELPHRALTNLAAKYGPLMHLQLGELSTLVITSSEAAKQVMKTHDITFANRPSSFATETFCYNNTDIGFAPHGEYWRQLRKICTIELLSTRRVQSFRSLREQEFSNMCKWLASKQGTPINLSEKVILTTCDTVMRASLGNKTDELTTFIPIAKEAADLGAGFNLAELYPSIGLFRVITGYRGRVQRLHQLSDRILDNFINNHKVASDENKKGEDFADVLLKYNNDGHDVHLTIENIKAVLQDMFNAGIETSSTTIDWAMAEMLKHPRILNKAQDEVRRVFSEKGFVDEQDFDELQYLKLVIKETLRMHPPLPLLLPRENYESCEINGYKIPAKTRVLVNVWAIGRDPKHWKDADSFMPERYLDVSVDYKGNNFEYIPFGAGRRICPGIAFGMANVELPLAMFLYHFDWKLADGMKAENVDMTETFGITAKRKNPLYVIPIIKRPLSDKDT